MKSNADRIREMSDDKLADFLEKATKDFEITIFDCEKYKEKFGCNDCKRCILEWLKKSVGVDE